MLWCPAFCFSTATTWELGRWTLKGTLVQEDLCTKLLPGNESVRKLHCHLKKVQWKQDQSYLLIKAGNEAKNSWTYSDIWQRNSVGFFRAVSVPISFQTLLGNFHRQWQVFSGLVTPYYSLSYTFLIRILKLFHLSSLANDLSNFPMYLSCYVFNWLSTFFSSMLMDFDARADFKKISV